MGVVVRVEEKEVKEEDKPLCSKILTVFTFPIPSPRRRQPSTGVPAVLPVPSPNGWCDTEAEHPTKIGNNILGHQFISFTVPNDLPAALLLPLLHFSSPLPRSHTAN